MMRRELNPKIQLPEKARLRLTALETATETALQSRRFVDEQIKSFGRDLSLPLDPATVADLKRELAATQEQREPLAKRFAELNDRLAAIYRWSDNFIVDCIRKHKVVPPFVDAEIDENSTDPLKWLGIKPGKAVAPRSRQQRRAERAASLHQHPGEHPLDYARRMNKLTGRQPRERVEVPAEELNRSMMSTMERNFQEWAKQ